MNGERTIEDLCVDIAQTAEHEKGMDIHPNEVGWVVAEFIEGFIGTPTETQMPTPLVKSLLEIAAAARKARSSERPTG